MIKRNITLIFNILILTALASSLVLNTIHAEAAQLVSKVTPIRITGNNFIQGASVSLDSYGSRPASLSSSPSMLTFLPASVPVSASTVNLINPNSSSVSIPDVQSFIADAATVALSDTVVPATSIPTATVPPLTAAPTTTVEPPNSYERPVIMVDSYSLDQDTISPGNSFTLFVTLYNAGQQYAKNIVATFSTGDLMPRGTGGVVAVGEIAPGNHSEFGQPLYLSSSMWATTTSINMVVSYTNEAGAAYSETFTISLPVHLVYTSGATITPTSTPSPTASVKPQLVITSYKTDVSPLQPGTQFNLAVNIQNMGNSTAKNVTMIVGGGSSTSSGDGGTQQPGGVSGGSGEFTNFAPIGSSNVQSLGDFSPGLSFTANQTLIVNVNTAPGAYPLKISFTYNNDQNHTFVDDQVITLLVYRIPILEVSFYQEVSTVSVGQPNTLPIQVVNLGRNSVVLGMMRVEAPSGQLSNNSILVGALDPGGYFTLDATFVPDAPGSTDILVSIDYTNDFNQPQVISETLSVDVMDQSVILPPVDGNQGDGTNIPPQSPETFLHKVWRFVLGLIGLDSGLGTAKSTNNNPAVETPSPQKPVIIPVQPPLKGP
jgi:hypothetical protein